MNIRFQADADLNQIIVLATVRREPAVDFRTALSAGLRGLSDPDVLAVAARDNRVLVTHDHRTMPRHFARFIATTPSPGLIVLSQRLPVIATVEDLLLVWSATDADEWKNRIWFFPL